MGLWPAATVVAFLAIASTASAVDGSSLVTFEAAFDVRVADLPETLQG